MLHILHNRLLPNRFLDLTLRLDIERIHIQALDLLLLLDLCRVLPFLRLFEKFSEACGVVLGCGGEFWLGLCERGCERTGMRGDVGVPTCCSWRMRSGLPRSWSLIISASCSTGLRVE
jgi:hypothetical protein